MYWAPLAVTSPVTLLGALSSLFTLLMYLTIQLIANNIFFLYFLVCVSQGRYVQAANFTHILRVPLNNAGLQHGTDLQYYGSVGFGTPPQIFNVMFDTSSSGVEIPGIMCVIPCMNQQQFDYTASSTFKNSQKKTTIGFRAGGPSKFTFQSMDVLQVSDTMTFLGQRFPGTPFRMVTNQTSGFFLNPYDGIIGLNLDTNSAVYDAIRKMGYPVMFGLYLTPSRVGGAEFSVGGVDESKLNGTNLTWVPAIRTNATNKRWSLAASKIYVNGEEMDSNLFRNRQFVFHTGESGIIVEKQLASAMYSRISPKIAAIGTDGNYGTSCNEIPSLKAVITFTFSSIHGLPFNLTLPSKDLNTGAFVDNPSICRTVIDGADIQGGIIGVSLLKHYYTVWDVDSALIGFASNGY